MKFKNYIEKNKVVKIDFEKDQFIPVEYPKKQIIMHHSAGWDNARGMFNWWASNKQRVATCVGIEDDGMIYQGFDSKYYGWHVNVASRSNNLPAHLTPYKAAKYSVPIEKHSVAFEICNWGVLSLMPDGKFHTWASSKKKPITIDDKKVIHYPDHVNPAFCDRYYERYTDQEIESIYSLISHWCQKYGIPKDYNEDMWSVSEAALNGTPGIWTHVSFRTDKTDCHPQPELIEALKSL